MTATHQQRPDGPDEAARQLTRQLADIARAEPARFAAIVRASDRMIAAGRGRDEALRAAMAEVL